MSQDDSNRTPARATDRRARARPLVDSYPSVGREMFVQAGLRLVAAIGRMEYHASRLRKVTTNDQRFSRLLSYVDRSRYLEERILKTLEEILAGESGTRLESSADGPDQGRRQKQLEELGGVACDTGNLVMGIDGHCRILLEGDVSDGDFASSVESVQREASRAHDAIFVILSWFRRRESPGDDR